MSQIDELLLVDNQIGEYSEDELSQSCYWKLSMRTTVWPCNIIVPVCVYAILLPMVCVLLGYQESLDNTLMFPRNTDTSDGKVELIKILF